ncbi:BatD family protein [Horticoccus luteus]|uniref:BatD family protein n=1 Tax=Horticoccus luteus TaxID=2862869 RepID=A0A8F9TU73_9BACT|nr:BatD family protein [Horticoccus luteus]QYM77869.1 BatD family protein [Horticoccus luteus]
MRLARLPFLLFVFALTLTAFAQTVRWEPGDSGDPADLQLVFSDCEPTGRPDLPVVAGVTFNLAGTGTRTEMNNFSFTRFTIFNYRVNARQAGPLQIPAFDVKTNKGTLRVAAYDATLTASTDVSSLAHATLEPAAANPWAGQIFSLTYTLTVPRRNLNQVTSNVAWNAAPLVAEDWANPQPAESIADGERQYVLTYHTRAYAKTAGRVTLEATAQNVNFQTGSVGFGLFQSPRIEQATVASNRPEISVRPLPQPAPAGFAGAVGQFKLTSKVVPAKAAVGEPVTWTLELSGTGNWPDIAGLPSREVSKDFQVVQPQAKRVPAEGKLFDSTLTEDVVLVPTKPGTYALAPISFVYFDPQAGTYKTLTPAGATVTITAANAPKFNVTPGAATPNPATTETAVAPPAKLPVSPELPTGLPLDDLSGTATVTPPWTWATLRWLLALPLVLLPLAWFTFAAQRAWRRDPHRPRRAALVRLRALLAQLRATTDPVQQRPLLRAWQTEVAAVWPLASAAPRADTLADAPWQTLWTEADHVLYGPDGSALPGDWIARAETAAAAKRVPGFALFRAFRHLVPALAVLALFLAGPRPAHADEATTAYRNGDFSGAETLWRATVEKQPTDWIARYNLSLALAQQDRWQEAVAHATAALLQNPSSPAVRWQFALACDKAGYTPAGLSPFINAGTKHRIARLASSAVWQRVLLAGELLIILAAILALARAYGFLSRRAWAIAPWLAVVAGLVLGVAAISSVRGYGDAGNPHAVLVWRNTTLRSIPTEADAAQKTIALPAGSFAVINKTFLADHWVRLAFSNGQTGWVRREEVVALWQ